MTYDQGLVFEVRRSWVSNYVGRDRRGTWVEGVEVRTSSPPSLNLQFVVTLPPLLSSRNKFYVTIITLPSMESYSKGDIYG